MLQLRRQKAWEIICYNVTPKSILVKIKLPHFYQGNANLPHVDLLCMWRNSFNGEGIRQGKLPLEERGMQNCVDSLCKGIERARMGAGRRWEQGWALAASLEIRGENWRSARGGTAELWRSESVEASAAEEVGPRLSSLPCRVAPPSPPAPTAPPPPLRSVVWGGEASRGLSRELVVALPCLTAELPHAAINGCCIRAEEREQGIQTPPQMVRPPVT
jgi:hypothetical protein